MCKSIKVAGKMLAVVAFTIGLVVMVATSYPKTEVVGTGLYVVRQGDTLWSIAETYAPNSMDLREYVYLLKEHNDGITDILYVGQEINIPLVKGSDVAVVCMAKSVESDTNYALLMVAAMLDGNHDDGRCYSQLRDEKKIRMGYEDRLTYDDLLLMAKIIEVEAGSNWLTEEHRQLVGSVVLNRVDSYDFPNTLYEVVYQKGQYALARTNHFENLVPSEKSIMSAMAILVGGSIAPKNVVYQSNFRQGSGVYKIISDRYLGNSYFCYR